MCIYKNTFEDKIFILEPTLDPLQSIDLVIGLHTTFHQTLFRGGALVAEQTSDKEDHDTTSGHAVSPNRTVAARGGTWKLKMDAKGRSQQQLRRHLPPSGMPVDGSAKTEREHPVHHPRVTPEVKLSTSC